MTHVADEMQYLSNLATRVSSEIVPVCTSYGCETKYGYAVRTGDDEYSSPVYLELDKLSVTDILYRMAASLCHHTGASLTQVLLKVLESYAG